MRNIDLMALIASVIAAVVVTIISVRKSEIALRPIAAFFMFFGPAAIFVHMSFHIGEINYQAIENIQKGSFSYNFRYYSLMLMAAAIVYCAGLLLQRIKRFLEGERSVAIFKAIAMTVVVSAPTIPFTPIGSLPTLACMITLCALPFVKMKRITVIAKKYPKVVTKRKPETIDLLRFV